jgi:hypothetical protein
MIYQLLLIPLLVVLFVYFKTLFFPDEIGRIIKIKKYKLDNTCKNCLSQIKHASINVEVEVNKKIRTAEVSHCNICLGQIKEGFYVGVSKVGQRFIVQPLLFPFLQKRRLGKSD